MKARYEAIGKAIEVPIDAVWDTYMGPTSWVTRSVFEGLMTFFGYTYTYNPVSDTFFVEWDKGRAPVPGLVESDDGETLYPIWSTEISWTLIKD